MSKENRPKRLTTEEFDSLSKEDKAKYEWKYSFNKPWHLIEETTPIAGLQNPYDPIKEPSSHRFWKDKQDTTPVPISEQKQEGEIDQIEDLISEICNWLREKYKGNGLYSPIYYVPPSTIAECIIEWQSQHAARHIEERDRYISILKECLEQAKGNNLQIIDSWNKQIDQYKARIVELEALAYSIKETALSNGSVNSDELINLLISYSALSDV